MACDGSSLKGSEARELEMIQLLTNERSFSPKKNKKGISTTERGGLTHKKGLEPGQGECQISARQWCIQ
jgi:hypothetical protein